MKAKNNTGILIVVFLFTTFGTMSQDFPEWPVPDDAAAVENPVAPTLESLGAGMSLFNLQCKACHGEKGLGDGLIKAANLTTETYLAQSDGSVFWRMHQGRSQMPSFKALPDEDLWNVINYVRSLSIPPDNLVKKNATIKLLFDETADKKTIHAEVHETSKDGQQIPSSGVKVNFGVKRYFGVLPIAGETSFLTDEKGEVILPFNEEIIGDENGDLTIIASIESIEYNPVSVSEVITWGSVNKKDYWTERRALWKNNDYVPIWLLISFVVGTLAIWGVIAYVGLLVFKIKRIGDKAGY